MTTHTPERTRLTLDIDPELLRDLKIEAVIREESVKDYVTRLIRVARESEPEVKQT